MKKKKNLKFIIFYLIYKFKISKSIIIERRLKICELKKNLENSQKDLQV